MPVNQKKLAGLCDSFVTHFCFSFSGKPCPAFKLVILDEADSMTPSAQVCLSLYSLEIMTILLC